MHGLSDLEFLARLAVGVMCGALIGLERQARARMAGLRTNALVATGATLFVEYSDIAGNTNTTQVAAYVVSGVGFLGGGVILRDGFNVSGLNTAATLWCSAAVGVLAASGHPLFAVDATAAVLLIHLVGRPLGRLVDPSGPGEEREDLTPYRLRVTAPAAREPRIRELVIEHAGTDQVVLRGLESTLTPDGRTTVSMDLLVDGTGPLLLEELVARIGQEPGVASVGWQSDVLPEQTRRDSAPR